jgi:hypothetical protein
MQGLTQGSITRHLFKLAGFMIFTMVFQTLYLLADVPISTFAERIFAAQDYSTRRRTNNQEPRAHANGQRLTTNDLVLGTE